MTEKIQGPVEEKIRLKVFRANIKKGNGTYFSTYDIPVQRWTTVLDALLYAKFHLDSSIAIRYSCRMASCGSCGMKINGFPRLACYTKISELESSEVVCEPLSNFPIVRDLVTDFSQFFNHHKNIHPFIMNSTDESETPPSTHAHIQSPEDVNKYLQFSYCIKCGLCYSACPTVATDIKFPGPQALSQLYRYHSDSRDAGKKRLDVVDNRHGVWRCHFAGSCSKVCPKGVDPALGIQLLRSFMLGLSKD
jgi:succinate dehydrogenase / fumarate reductase iron-sulfur subunit